MMFKVRRRSFDVEKFLKEQKKKYHIGKTTAKSIEKDLATLNDAKNVLKNKISQFENDHRLEDAEENLNVLKQQFDSKTKKRKLITIVSLLVFGIAIATSAYSTNKKRSDYKTQLINEEEKLKKEMEDKSADYKKQKESELAEYRDTLVERKKQLEQLVQKLE